MLVDDNNAITGNEDDTITGNTSKEKVKKWDIFTGKEPGTFDRSLSLYRSEWKKCSLFCL